MIFALVDYHNEASSRGNALSDAQDYLQLLEEVVADVTRSARVLASGEDEVLVRLYGGWYDEQTGEKTRDRDLAGVACERIARRGWGRLRILPECADSPLADEALLFWNTLRSRQRAPQLRHIYHAALCGRRTPCAMPDLNAWIQGRCPHYTTCRTRRDEVIGWFGQKMVDATLSSDMFHIGLSQMGPSVIVANDDDYVPSIVTARMHDLRVWILHSNRRSPSTYLDTLEAIDAVEALP